MSCASRRVKVMFILGCGSSRENAIISGLLPNLLAIRSNGGASATCLPWFGSMAWQEAQRACAKRFPLSASAAKDADTSSSNGSRKHKELSCPFLGDLLRELHPLHITPDIISSSRRLERDLGIEGLGRTELVLRLDDLEQMSARA